MKFIKSKIPEVVIVEPKVFQDERGYFVETFRKDKLDEFLGYSVNFCQDNESKSTYGVLRGLHYQLEPYAQSKLVRVVKGEILDIAVDIRKDSPTFRQYVGVILNEENKKQLFIPKGFAHGFVTLSNEAIVMYKVDNYYAPKYDRGILYSDPELSIDWKLKAKDIELSSKDKRQPLLADIVIENLPGGVKLERQ